MAASSSSNADPRLAKYDVFISFRGETRNSFTSHLYFALCQKHIKAYIDEVSLEKGDDIERALPMAIKQSAISIIVFSENYASSRWCLDELVDILKCKKEQDQIVLTIFYGIDPSHIRQQKGTYAAAFVKHEARYHDKIVEEWRQALTRAADLSGWDSRDKSESVLVQQVVEVVIRKLESISSTSIDDFKGLFGIPRQLCEIESLLCFDSQNVRILGIWGMGGIGKTTLARVVFQRFSNRFERTCFLESVREESERKGLVELEKEVFSKLLGEKDPDVNNPFVKVRLSRTKALLVLDDVDHFEQLRRLAGDRDRFGPGSKIILTSRDLQVLNQLIDVRYEVQALEQKEASQLFYLKALEENSDRSGYEEISAEVVNLTRGNPLALQVLGSSLKSLGVKQWQSALENLKSTPHVDIQKALRISYDGLGTKQQDVFLDIACILKDEKRDVVEGILGHESIYAIDVLVKKSLITVNQYGLIGMHDLIQEMGWEIVRQSTKKLGKRSRLWTAKDVSDVSNNNEGTEAIEGIYFPPIKEHEDVQLRPDVFKKMRKLRLLKFYASHNYVFYGKGKVAIDGDLESLPNSLRYLHWEHYPGKSLPSNSEPQNLVELHMPNSKLEQLWDGVQKLGSLKHINLHHSKLLTKIPDLSLAPKLECINLSRCESLIHIPSLNLQASVDESAYRHQWLSVENGNFEAERTPGCIILHGCFGLTSLPKVSGNIRKLVLSSTALKELPSSIESLENLLLLDLRECCNLKSLPKLPRNIEVLLLDFSGIEQIPSSSIDCLCSLSSLPSNINLLTALEELDLIRTSIQALPSTTGMLYNLKKLHISHCFGLQSLPASIGMLYYLEKLDISHCFCLQSLPASIGMLYNLEKLDISHCFCLQSLPASIGMLYNLEKLDISHCFCLQSLPASIGMLYNLEKLDISHCFSLQSLPASIGMLYKLKKLDLSYCSGLQSLPELPLFIESVNARGCSSLEMVSTSRSTLTLGRWLDKYDSDRLDEYDSDRESDGDGDRFGRAFSFLNCTNLGEDAINNIFREFLYKVFCTATTPRKIVVSKRVIGKVVVCYPTMKIPSWFNNQSKGSSITSLTITLPPNWYNPKTFLGFVVSVIFKKVRYGFDPLKRKLHFKTYCFESRKEVVFEYATFHTYFGGDFEMDEGCSYQIVMWYEYFDHSKANFEKYQKASFKFKIDDLKVKWCGVRMLYLKDAVEESDDGSTANFESWITDVIDSDKDYATTYDLDEPPPKKTRNL